MFALKNEIAIGYKQGTVVLSDLNDVLPTRYLSKKNSALLYALTNFDLSKDYYINALGVTKEDIDDFIVSICDYIYDAGSGFVGKMSKVSDKLFIIPSKTISNKYKLDYPNMISWVPTWVCNRNCLYCGVPRTADIDKEKRIDPEIITSILKEAIDHGVRSLNIHGGEPLFYYDLDVLFDLIRYACNKNVKVLLSSKNKINNTLAHKLADTGLRTMQLSLDAMDDVLLKSIYGPDYVLSDFVESVKTLKRHNIDVVVNVVVTTLNYKYVKKLLAFLEELHVDTVKLSPYKKGNNNGVDYSMNENEKILLHQDFKESDKHRSTKIIFSPFQPKVVSVKNKGLCGGGRNELLILPDGTCCLCDMLYADKRFIFGDLINDSIEDIWLGDDLNKLISPCAIADRPICKVCPEITICAERGFCYAETTQDHSLPDGRSLECLGSLC